MASPAVIPFFYEEKKTIGGVAEEMSCAHSAREAIHLSNLVPGALTYALTAAAFCQ